MKICVYLLLAFALQMAHKCEAGSCSVIYDNKCFVVAAGKNGWDNDGAVKYCKSLGGYVANLYSQSHMDAVMSYIRKQKWFYGNDRYRTGMNFDHLENKLTLRDGTDAPDGLKWYPGRPSTGADWDDFTNVILRISPDPSSISQYLINYPPRYITNVICEIE